VKMCVTNMQNINCYFDASHPCIGQRKNGHFMLTLALAVSGQFHAEAAVPFAEEALIPI